MMLYDVMINRPNYINLRVIRLHNIHNSTIHITVISGRLYSWGGSGGGALCMHITLT